jgi:hypothetical protein
MVKSKGLAFGCGKSLIKATKIPSVWWLCSTGRTLSGTIVNLLFN